MRLRLVHGPTDPGAAGHARRRRARARGVPQRRPGHEPRVRAGRRRRQAGRRRERGDGRAAGAARRPLAAQRRSADRDRQAALPRRRDASRVDASLGGAAGDAFVDFEGARAMGEQTVPASGGRASATFTVPETVGDAAVGVAFVRDGALEYATQRVAIDGPGHARATTLAADRTDVRAGQRRARDDRRRQRARRRDARDPARATRAPPAARRSTMPRRSSPAPARRRKTPPRPIRLARVGRADALDRARPRRERPQRAVGRDARRAVGARAACGASIAPPRKAST